MPGSSFRPHPLLRGAHLQTMASLLRPTPKLDLRCERLELPDGDFVDVGWSGDHNQTGPLAVLVHGLCGGFESKYARGTACQLVARGWRTVILQLRGAGPEPNRLEAFQDRDVLCGVIRLGQAAQITSLNEKSPANRAFRGCVQCIRNGGRKPPWQGSPPRRGRS